MKTVFKAVDRVMKMAHDDGVNFCTLAPVKSKDI